MTPEECAARTTPAVSGLSSHFMLDGNTYKKGAEQGFAGLDFYAAGRAGVLGRLDADEVTRGFGFFEPVAVAGWLEQAGQVMSPQECSAAFMDCGYDWADAHLGDDVDWDRLSQLLADAIASAPDQDLPLFRAWRDAPEPDRGAKALALHRFNVLRELRNEIHVQAVANAGLEPLEALLVKTPQMAPIFGWTGELPEVGDEQRAKHAQAEAETNRRMAPAFADLDEAERDELVALADAAAASIS